MFLICLSHLTQAALLFLISVARLRVDAALADAALSLAVLDAGFRVDPLLPFAALAFAVLAFAAGRVYTDTQQGEFQQASQMLSFEEHPIVEIQKTKQKNKSLRSTRSRFTQAYASTQTVLQIPNPDQVGCSPFQDLPD